MPKSMTYGYEATWFLIYWFYLECAKNWFLFSSIIYLNAHILVSSLAVLSNANTNTCAYVKCKIFRYSNVEVNSFVSIFFFGHSSLALLKDTNGPKNTFCRMPGQFREILKQNFHQEYFFHVKLVFSRCTTFRHCVQFIQLVQPIEFSSLFASILFENLYGLCAIVAQNVKCAQIFLSKTAEDGWPKHQTAQSKCHSKCVIYCCCCCFSNKKKEHIVEYTCVYFHKKTNKSPSDTLWSFFVSRKL